MNEKVPETLGRYEVQEEIGRGMMGVVYRGLDPTLGRTVALKTVCLGFSIPEAERTVFEQRFLAEARVAAALSHPAIVVVHDMGRDEASSTLFIAMEYLQGETLSDKAAARKRLPWPEALRLAARLAEALHHAHSHGVVHRDVKPANIMVLANGEPKLMDFGIAKVPTSQLTGAGEFFGTPSYMSPEQAAGGPIDGRSDLFSLGAVLHFLLTGSRAFDGPNVGAILDRIAHEDPRPASALAPELPPDLDDVLARVLAKDPARRYPDGRAFAEDLDDVREGRPPRHRPPRPRPAASREAPARPDERPALPPVPAAAAGPAAGRVAHVRERFGGVLGLGGVVAAGLLLALVLTRAAPPGGAGGPHASPPSSETGFALHFLRQPAQLEVYFEHSARSGSFKLWVDDDLALEEPLESQVVRKVLSMGVRKGTLQKVVDLPPGEHVIRVEVLADGDLDSRQVRASFESGTRRRLEVSRGGLPLLKKELSLRLS